MSENKNSKQELIISLTSYPARIKTIHKVIESLLNQTKKADKVILWLAPEQFENKEKDLPQDLLALTKQGLIIDWYHDIRSYKKLIPTLRKYPDAIIVTADDDNLYKSTWLEQLYNSYLSYPNDIHCHRVTKILCHSQFDAIAGGKEYWDSPSYLNKLVGMGGVLYPPHCFYKDILDENLIFSLAPTNDDLWFWLQAVLNNVKIRVISSPIIESHLIEETQETALCLINDAGEHLFWKDFHNILGYYPTLRTILRKEYNMLTNHTMDDDVYDLLKWYKRKFQYRLKLSNPKTYNEKMQWLKLYNAIPIKTVLADKYTVRNWVAQKIGKEYLIDLLGVYERFDDIDFNKLPSQFVIKCTHGCGYNLIVKDKSTFNIDEARKTVNAWLDENFAYTSYEMHYKNIKPKIIIEKYIQNHHADDLYDYKFWCFNGKVEYIQFLSDRYKSGLKMAFFDRNWNKQNFVYNYPRNESTISKPKQLQEMIEISEKLASEFVHARVDLYLSDEGKIYFGEITFTSASGNCQWNDKKIDQTLGNMIKLPLEMYDYQTNKFITAKPKSYGRIMIEHFLKVRKSKKISLFHIEKRSHKMVIKIFGVKISIKRN